MDKYYFIREGQNVKWDLFNDGEFKTVKVCGPVPTIINDDTLISVLSSNQQDSVECDADTDVAYARELSPILTEFNKGYWCALQDAVSNGASSTTIKEMVRGAGFTFWETYWHMKESDFYSSEIRNVIRDLFCTSPYFIDWQGVDYPVKDIQMYKDTSDEKVVTVSVERLEGQLMDDMGNWSTREAQYVDEKIYFYLDEEIFNYPDKDIAEYLECQEQ